MSAYIGQLGKKKQYVVLEDFNLVKNSIGRLIVKAAHVKGVSIVKSFKKGQKLMAKKQCSSGGIQGSSWSNCSYTLIVNTKEAWVSDKFMGTEAQFEAKLKKVEVNGNSGDSPQQLNPCNPSPFPKGYDCVVKDGKAVSFPKTSKGLMGLPTSTVVVGSAIIGTVGFVGYKKYGIKGAAIGIIGLAALGFVGLNILYKR